MTIRAFFSTVDAGKMIPLSAVSLANESYRWPNSKRPVVTPIGQVGLFDSGPMYPAAAAGRAAKQLSIVQGTER